MLQEWKHDRATELADELPTNSAVPAPPALDAAEELADDLHDQGVKEPARLALSVVRLAVAKAAEGEDEPTEERT